MKTAIKYEITTNDNNIFKKLLSQGRFNSNDLSNLKRIYETYINQHLKKHVDWNCPTCIRQVRDELITFRNKSKVI